MKYLRLASLLVSIAMCMVAQVAPSQIDFFSNTPPQVTASTVTAQVVGTAGTRTLFYWIIAVYPSGRSFPTGPVRVDHAPDAMSVTNFVRVGWQPVNNALGYDICRTTTPNFPNGTNTIGIGLSLTALSISNVTDAVFPYTLTVTPGAAGYMKLNNQDYATPRYDISPTTVQSLNIQNLSVSGVPIANMLALVLADYVRWNPAMGNLTAIPKVTGANFIGESRVYEASLPYSVTDYGAVSGTDVTLAYEAAYAALPATGGTIVFPSGDWLLNSGRGLRIKKSNVAIVGVGAASHIIVSPTVDITRDLTVVGSVPAAIEILGSAAGGRLSNIAVRNLRITGRNTANAGQSKLIYYQYVDGLIIDSNVGESNYYEGFWSNPPSAEPTHVRITNNRLANIAETTFLPAIQVNNTQSTVSGNVMKDVGSGIGASGYKLTLSGNVVQRFYLHGIATGDNQYSDQNIVITGNVIGEGIGAIAGNYARNGIYITGSPSDATLQYNYVASSNIIYDCYVGITSVDRGNALIESNSIALTANSYAGILSTAYNLDTWVTIRGNDVIQLASGPSIGLLIYNGSPSKSHVLVESNRVYAVASTTYGDSACYFETNTANGTLDYRHNRCENGKTKIRVNGTTIDYGTTDIDFQSTPITVAPGGGVPVVGSYTFTKVATGGGCTEGGAGWGCIAVTGIATPVPALDSTTQDIIFQAAPANAWELGNIAITTAGSDCASGMTTAMVTDIGLTGSTGYYATALTHDLKTNWAFTNVTPALQGNNTNNATNWTLRVTTTVQHVKDIPVGCYWMLSFPWAVRP